VAQDLRPRLSCWRWLPALLLVACGGDAAPVPRAVDTASLAADAALTAVLDECHRPLRGRMDRIDAAVTLPDGTAWRVFARLPDQVRLQSVAGQFLLRSGKLVHLPDGAEATAAELATATALRDVVDAAALGPLHRATAAARGADGSLVLTQPNGDTAHLVLRDGTLLPARLTLGNGTRVQLPDWTRTPLTWLATAVDTPSLGRCRIEFQLGDITWADDFFALPGAARPRTGNQHIVSPGAVAETQSPVPIVVDGKQLQWIVVADPGDWPGRVEAYRPLHAELTAQDQWIAGFPVLFRDRERPFLAAPFRARAGGAEFAAPAGWQLRSFASGKWLVVYPPDGDLAARVQAGERMLQEELQRRQLVARGPITAQPYLHLHQGVPPADKLTAPVVRVAVAIE
jgi:hypothetical protein